MEIRQLLKLGIKENASDLHLVPGLPLILRIEGDLKPMALPVLEAQTIQNFLFGLLEKEQQTAFYAHREIDFAFSVPELGRFRVAAFQQMNGAAAVIRVIPHQIPDWVQLQLPSVLKQLSALTHGLILITGPTGCGKSTTMAAMINHMNNEGGRHIITIEDPIEFVHTHKNSVITQRQVDRDTHSFTAALRSALRADPDVIVLGELRDLEMMRLALIAAETGHLVIATMHTHSAPQTINRIIDIFPSHEKSVICSVLAESLQAVISQKLVKYSHKRRGIFEIMLTTPAIRNLIKEDKIAQLYTCIQTGHEFGMCTFEQYIQQLTS